MSFWGRCSLAFSVLFLWSCTYTPPADLNDLRPVSPAERSMEKAMKNRVDAERRRRGLKSFTRDRRLDAVARLHSQEMAERGRVFGHSGFHHRFNLALSRMGYGCLGENVGYYTGDGAGSWIFNGWMKSRGHRQQILGDGQFAGCGVAKSPDGVSYVTMLFAIPRSNLEIKGPQILRDEYGRPR